MQQEEALFLQACGRAAARTPGGGVGTLGERTLHATLKYYFAPNEANHECAVGPYVADILRPDGEIIEVQTRGFHRLRDKLELFLQQHPVRVVYPVAATKWLVWVQPETGECTPKRKSPKRGSPQELFNELYWIKPYLTHPNLRLTVMLVDIEEYRLRTGWSEDGKRGSTRVERIPVALRGQLDIEKPGDYTMLLAPVQQPFTAKDYKAATGLSLHAARTAMNLLCHVGVLEKSGRSGRQQLYKSTKA